MGWDVVEIGLKHDLPLEDPMATAEAVAQRLNMNISLVYENKYKYDKQNNIVTYNNQYEFIELKKFRVNKSDSFLQMIASEYQKKQLIKQIGLDKLSKATYYDFLGQKKDFCSELASTPFELYEIESNDESSIDIQIFKENVDLGIDIYGRWSSWERYFYNISENIQILHDYRMQIYKRSQLFGCKEVIICADQGPGLNICANIDMPADKLKSYIRNFEYLMNDGWIKDSERDEWRKNARHIMFSSVFQERLKFSKNEFIEVIYDDFADLNTIEKDAQ